MARYFQEQDIAEFRDCFSLYARTGFIRNVDELTVIMRSLRTSPTNAELKDYMKSKNGKILFDDFLEIMHTHKKKEKSATEIRKAFVASDTTKKGLISTRELRHILLDWGERLSPKEGIDIFFGLNRSASCIFPANFVRILSAEGDVVEVTRCLGNGWLFGSSGSRQGQFPESFVERLS
nr:EOG090X0GKM [Eulimnadia texana]